MNLGAIEACKEMDDFIRKLPEDLFDGAFPLFDSVKRVALSADEYAETLDEPMKSSHISHLADARMHLKIRDVCKEDDIFELLFDEYLSASLSNEDHKREALGGISERFKEVYEQHADRIAEYREELGLINPHIDGKSVI
jgi:hypothetical protein